MLAFLLSAQLLATPAQAADTNTALRDLIDRAAARNGAAPATLHAYRAQVESEIAVLSRRADGAERALSIEQAQNDVHWRRTGEFEQHITAHRARQAGPSLSALAVIRSAWTIPVLYGNRLSLFFGSSSSLGAAEPRGPAAQPGRQPPTLAAHPFGPERNAVYAFRGGDTVATLRTSSRSIAIVRVHVEPRPVQDGPPVVVFRGEIDLDAERGEIVRMRGQFLTLGENGPVQRRLLVMPMEVVAFVDLESIEVDGRYWLPRFQRIETHVNFGGFAEGRSVFRIVSRFRGHEVTTRVVGAGRLPGDEADDASPLAADSSEPADTEHRLTLAAPDSLRGAVTWWQPLGEATAALRGDDFNDVGAGDGVVAGRSAVSWRAQRLADVVHFNRVEGWTTGASVAWRPLRHSEDLTVRANASWAWSERAVRGRLELARATPKRGWGGGLRVGRTLDITNDFTAPHDSGGALAGMAGVDAYDYVDRAAAAAWASASVVPRRLLVRAEAGLARDRGVLARLTSGPLPGDAPFLPNRGVDDGRYARGAVVAEWHPDVLGSAMATGFGAQLQYEGAAGQLEWRRATVRVTARHEGTAVGWAMRVDGGVLASDAPPPQQLFEVGGGASLPGFEYKAFAGDRALSARGRVAVRLPILRAPLRVLGCACFTAPAPALAVTLYGARVTASGAAAVASIARLGSTADRVGEPPAAPGTGQPVARPTDGWRASAEVGLRFFGGAATIGAARRLEPGARWRAVLALGQSW